MEFLVYLIPILMLIVFGSIGRLTEHNHLRHLDREEAELAHVTVTNLKTAPTGMAVVEQPFVIGEAVIGSDYLKTAFASLRAIVGGEVKSFQRLLERGRREAIIRMKRQAAASGASMVINVRVERAELGSANLPAAEIIATGTAVR